MRLEKFPFSSPPKCIKIYSSTQDNVYVSFPQPVHTKTLKTEEKKKEKTSEVGLRLSRCSDLDCPFSPVHTKNEVFSKTFTLKQCSKVSVFISVFDGFNAGNTMRFQTKMQ